MVWFSVIVLAVAGSQLLNDLIIIFHLNDIFPSYQEMTSVVAGQPMWGSVLAVGRLLQKNWYFVVSFGG